MKGIKRILSIVFIAAFITALACITVSAEGTDDSALTSLISGGTTVIANAQNEVSTALDVIAYQNQMAIAGITGNALSFSAERFACAMNLSSIESITVTALPDMSCGALYIGGEGVSVGQTISAPSLSLMTYEEASTGAGRSASFCFSVNGSSYEIACNIFMIGEMNYSPSVKTASYI